MLFNSLTFIVFFVITLVGYYLSPQRFRWPVLLVASIIFYMAWNPLFVFLLLISVAINFIAALKISQTQQKVYRKRWLILSLVFSFGVLFIFKYLILFTNTVSYFFEYIGQPLEWLEFYIILPIGISFYTFQAAGYTIDVYRQTYKPERNFFKFTLFITFFPPLVAGPIERAGFLMPQLFTPKHWCWEHFIQGIQYMAFGFFKKIVIADRLSTAVNTIYNAPQNFEGFHFILATFLFAFQIYCDFSGYSDIAVGAAKMFGIDLTQNFRQPYFAENMKDFWRRWHISLSTWFKDYVYFPLGGNRVSRGRHCLNTMITFLISGIWHGANWTFVLWGGIHGVYQVIGTLLSTNRSRQKKSLWPIRLLKSWITFILVCFAWIFFRANSIQDAFYIVSHLTSGITQVSDIQYVFDALQQFGLSFLELCIGLSSILLLILIESCFGERNMHEVLIKLPGIFRFLFYLVILLIIMSIGVFYNAGEFIYFQF